MQPTSAHILDTVRRTLAERVAPSLANTEAQALLGPLDVALAELLRRIATPDDGGAAERDVADSVARGRLLLAQDGGGEGGNAALASVMAGVQDCLAAAHDQEWRLQASAWIDEVVRDQYAAAFPSPPPAIDAPAEVEEIAVDQVWLAQRIGMELAGGAAVSIDLLRALSGGYSRDTLLVTWSVAGKTGDLVLRRQRLNSMLDGIGLSVASEYPLLRLAYERGVPVPAPLWIETDVAKGGPYIAMERARGGVIGTPTGASGVNDGVMRAAARMLAHLHTVRWEDCAAEIAPLFDLPSIGLTARVAAEKFLDNWEIYWAQQNLDPSPALSAAYHWLRSNVPQSDARPVILHGDTGFHNIMFENGEVTALLDWETAFIGDPARDMALCESFMGGQGNWSAFLDAYREAGGPEIDEAALRFYHVMRVFSYVLVAEMGWQTLFADVARPKIESMFLGGPIRQHFFADYLNYLPIISGSQEPRC